MRVPRAGCGAPVAIVWKRTDCTGAARVLAPCMPERRHEERCFAPGGYGAVDSGPKGFQVWCVLPDATVHDAIAEMALREVGALPVIDDGRLVGIISERDYARKVILQGRSSKETPVGQIMTPAPITVTPEQTVEECMQIMTQNRVRHLPVVDQGRLAGIVSIGDLVNAIISAQRYTIDQLYGYITAKYP